MSKSLRAVAITSVLVAGLSTPAMAESVWYGNYTSSHEAGIAEVVASVLTVDDLDPMIRQMLSGLITSEPGTVQYSVVDISYPDQLGTDQVVLMIGEDDLNDDDSGWGAVWSVEVNFQPRDQFAPYVIDSVSLGLAAG